MSVIPDNEQARRLAALEKYEQAVDRLHLFMNGDENTVIQTDSGPLPTLRALIRPLSEHETEVNSFMAQISETLEAVAVDPAPGSN